MIRRFDRLAAACVLFALLIPAPAFAQRIGIGLGIAAPITGKTIATQAHTDNGGVVRVDRTLDSSPQLFVEVHAAWKMTKKEGGLEIGPMMGFTPHVDFGSTSNLETEQPVAAGFGILISTRTFSTKKRLNVGVIWLVSAPITVINPAFADGFQAPRDSLDRPMAPTVLTRSTNRLAITISLSGLF